MSEIESSIGIKELEKIKEKILIRKKNYNYFISKLKNCKNFIILNSQSEKNFTSSYYALSLVLNNVSRTYRDQIILKLKSRGVQASIYYPHPVPLLNFYKRKYKYKVKDFKNSCRIAYNSISFPVAPHVNFKDIDYMSQLIKKIIK